MKCSCCIITQPLQYTKKMSQLNSINRYVHPDMHWFKIISGWTSRHWLLSEPCGSQWATPGRTDGFTSPQCILGILGHGISLIQYHQLEALPGGQKETRGPLKLYPPAVTGYRFFLKEGRWQVSRRGVQSYLKMVLVLAKLRMGPRTTSIPLSSEAFSYKIKLVKHRISSYRWTNQNEKLKQMPSHLNKPKSLQWEVVVHLQHHGVELLVLVQLSGTGEDGGGFSCSRGAIEQEMGKLVLTYKPLD